MLRRFKKMCEKEGLTKDMKRIAYYEKPSEKKRRRQRSAKPRMVGNMGGRNSSRSLVNFLFSPGPFGPGWDAPGPRAGAKR